RRRRTWALAAPFLVLALLALGKHTPLYALAFRVVPGWRTFRYPEKLVPFCALGLALAAGAGLQLVQSDEAVRRRSVLAFALTASACALLAALEVEVGLFSHLVATPLWHGRPPAASLARLGSNFV